MTARLIPLDAAYRVLLGELQDWSHELPPYLLADLAARLLQDVGAVDVVVYLPDYDQVELVVLPRGTEVVPSGPAVVTEAVEGTLPGRAFTTAAIVEWPIAAGVRVCLPLLDGADRVGVLALTLPALDDEWRCLLERFAGALTDKIVTKNAHTDLYFRARRRQPMGISAEMAWQQLPALTVRTPRLSLAGQVEPAYDVGGDVYDYALNADTAHVAIFDAMGHGVEAALMAALAVAAYRRARREEVKLEETYAAIEGAFSTAFGPERFVTAQLAELHLPTGRLCWVNAGHPRPLLIRGHRVVAVLEGADSQPIGTGGPPPAVAEVQLEPGDRLLFYTDGVTEQRRRGLEYGEDRLIEAVQAEASNDLPVPETVRRLARRLAVWREGTYDDDATMVLVQWHGHNDGTTVALNPPTHIGQGLL